MQTIIAAALAGLMATPHCAGMCGGFATACARPVRLEGRRRGPSTPARPDDDGAACTADVAYHRWRLQPGLWAWHAGRLATYAALGAVAGLVGGSLPGPAWLPALLAGTLLLWFAASLAGFVPQPGARIPGLARAGQFVARRPSTPARLLLGALTGLLPCGMVYAALSIAIAAGSPLYGAAAMVAFGAATVPGLTILAVGIQRFALRGRWSRRVVAAAVLVFGLWSVGQRGFTDRAHGHGSAEPAAVEHAGH
jgi:uncharacterized protein